MHTKPRPCSNSWKPTSYEIVPFDQKADVCYQHLPVTNIADRKSRQRPHRAKKMNPIPLWWQRAVMCRYADALKEDAAVDIIVGK